MLAQSRTLLVDNAKMLIVNMFNGTEWTEVVREEVGKNFRITKTRNTNRLLAVDDRPSASILYAIRGGLAHVCDNIMGIPDYLYEMDDGFHRLIDHNYNHLGTKHIFGDNWAFVRVPTGHCGVTTSLDDKNIYMLVQNETDLESNNYSPNVRVMGYIGKESWVTATVVVGGLMHVYEANYGRIIRYDSRVSHSGTIVFSSENYKHHRHRHSMFLNDHIFVKSSVGGNVDMVDMRNSTLWALPNVDRGPCADALFGVYG
jgi:hypothetical protein